MKFMSQWFLISASVVTLLAFPPASHSQPWSGIVSAPRAIDWSGAGVQGGIVNRTTVYQTLNPGVTADQINAAIAACPADQVVLPERRDLQFVKRHRAEKRCHGAGRGRRQDVSCLFRRQCLLRRVQRRFALQQRTMSGAATPTPCPAGPTPRSGPPGSRREPRR